jgi:hypothetical protein
MFPNLADRLEESNNGRGLNENLLSEIKVHLLVLEIILEIFPGYVKCFLVVKPLFAFDVI